MSAPTPPSPFKLIGAILLAPLVLLLSMLIAPLVLFLIALFHVCPGARSVQQWLRFGVFSALVGVLAAGYAVRARCRRIVAPGDEDGSRVGVGFSTRFYIVRSLIATLAEVTNSSSSSDARTATAITTGHRGTGNRNDTADSAGHASSETVDSKHHTSDRVRKVRGAFEALAVPPAADVHCKQFTIQYNMAISNGSAADRGGVEQTVAAAMTPRLHAPLRLHTSITGTRVSMMLVKPANNGRVYQTGATDTPPNDTVAANGGHTDSAMDSFPAELVFAPGADPSKLLIWIHGGGFYANAGLNAHRRVAGEFSRHAQAAVLLPDYRVLPESRWPTPLDDVHAAYLWALSKDGGGFSPDDIVLGGESAGGSALLLLMNRLPPTLFPKAIIPVSLADFGTDYAAPAAAEPSVTTTTTDTAVITPDTADDPMVTKHDLLQNWLLLQECGVREPFKLTDMDFTRFPPTLVQVGLGEVLLADSKAVVDAMRKQKVCVEIDFAHAYLHMSFCFAAYYKEAQQHLETIALFAKKHLFPKQPNQADASTDGPVTDVDNDAAEYAAYTQDVA